MRAREASSVSSRAIRLGVALLLVAASALAEGTPIPHGTLELIAEKWIEKRSLAAGEEFDVGLHFQLEKGWHIYWVNPGDSGEPPRVNWHLAAGLTAGAIEWPTPRRLEDSASIVDYGYEDAVVLVVPMHADPRLAAQKTVQLGADVKLLVCSHDMCIPGKAQLSLTIPIEAHASTQHSGGAQSKLRLGGSDLFTGTHESFPGPAPMSWKFGVADAKDSLVLTANLGQSKGLHITQAVFFPLAESQIANAAPQRLVPVADGFRLTLRKSDQLLKPIERLKGVLTISGENSNLSASYLIDAPVSLTMNHERRDP
jgi:DsbC/DsbD-like thiol-disulfide interchange protein